VSTALHLCGLEDLPRLAALCARYHEEARLDLSDDHRHAALAPLLEGSPLGAAYIAGPKTAPIGYLIVSFGWSIERGGMVGTVNELWVRPSVRGRGLGSEILLSVSKALSSVGLKALQLEVDREDDASQRLFARARFELRDRFALMTREA